MGKGVAVELFGSLIVHTSGERVVHVKAATIRELLESLSEDFPGLAPQLDRGVSVSIDGKVYTEALFQPISPDSEVVLLPRIAGG